MTLLRVYFDTPPDPRHLCAWALYDNDGRLQREGSAPLDQLPPADQREAVLSVNLAPTATLSLPPMGGARLEGAVRLALEDRLVTPVASLQIINQPTASGKILTRWTDRTLLDSLRANGFTRAISVADLIETVPSTWQCCVATSGQGFVRRDDGSAFALHLAPNAALPPELVLAVRQADPAPTQIVVNIASPERIVADWRNTIPTLEWRIGKPWRWATSSHFADAVNLFPPEADTRQRRLVYADRWLLALKIAAAALALHVLATGLAWGTSLWQTWQVSRGWQTLARNAGLPPSTDLATLQKNLSRAYAKKRHQSGRDAPVDALPLLAQMSPALSSLPAGQLRRLVYSDGAWTLEYQPLPTEQQKTLEKNLRQQGLAVLGGVNPNGYRVRIEQETVTP